MFPEKSPTVFERSLAPSIPMNKGPLRFEEGIATDTDVPRDFAQGAYQDTAPSPVRMNHNNPEMFYKWPEQTMAERAHVGAATWIEAPTVLSEFVQGSVAGDSMPFFEYEYNTGGHMNRPNPTVVWD
jgi:hypothetical protein